jgi:biotin synthase-like enzyme
VVILGMHNKTTSPVNLLAELMAEADPTRVGIVALFDIKVFWKKIYVSMVLT